MLTHWTSLTSYNLLTYLSQLWGTNFTWLPAWQSDLSSDCLLWRFVFLLGRSVQSPLHPLPPPPQHAHKALQRSSSSTSGAGGNVIYDPVTPPCCRAGMVRSSPGGSTPRSRTSQPRPDWVAMIDSLQEHFFISSNPKIRYVGPWWWIHQLRVFKMVFIY